MGARQSKRSVDISGKEAESAGEVAAAGAGGEGRVEQLADVDLKPQLNGDAHIQAEEQTEKEKQLDSGTPENEKDATTEKEGKEENEKEATPVVTNGESEPKTENGDSTPTPEDGKKPKKEKVKKKWSLRSISFSRKDKPKQEKKPKEEEVKTNGEPEKVPEEAAEATPENIENKVTEEVKPETEIKEEKTPETPVTEPITNGSSTPESAKNEAPAIEAESPLASPENDRPEIKAETEPEQLPLNGLSIEEKELPKVEQIPETKPEQPTAESTETVSAPEIPVKTEVCVDQMPLLEPTPPPLPANPPPSSVASFAATTMAPELTDALLANKIENANLALPSILDTKAIDEVPSESPCSLEVNYTDTCETLSLVKEPSEVKAAEPEQESEKVEFPVPKVVVEVSAPNPEIKVEEPILTQVVETVCEIKAVVEESEVGKIDLIETPVDQLDSNTEESKSLDKNATSTEENTQLNKIETITEINTSCQYTDTKIETEDNPELLEDFPPPPNEIDDLDNIVSFSVEEKKEQSVVNVENHKPEEIKTNGIETESLNGNDIETQHENLKNKTKDLNTIDKTEYNGSVDDDTAMIKGDSIEIKPVAEAASDKVVTSTEKTLKSEVMESIPQEDISSNGVSESSTSASKELIDMPQDPIPVSDKLADLIPEVPVVPELKTEMETSKDVAVAN